VRYNTKLSEAPGFGQHIFEYAKKSNGAADYALLVERLANGG
jgi:chromosome partitioning protein